MGCPAVRAGQQSVVNTTYYIGFAVLNAHLQNKHFQCTLYISRIVLVATSPVRYAKFESIRYFIDIDILQNCLIDIDIDIFQNHHIDIDIDIFGITLSISIFFRIPRNTYAVP